MPVQFLSDEQAAAYGVFTGDPSATEVERFFYLDDADRNLVAQRRPDSHGWGICLGRYAFATRAVDGLRPLRDPSARDDSDDEP